MMKGKTPGSSLMSGAFRVTVECHRDMCVALGGKS